MKAKSESMRVSLLATLVGSVPFLTPPVHGRATVVLEHRKSLPSGWRIESEASLQETISVSIALAQPKLAELEAYMLKQINRPISSSTHLTPAQLAAYQVPHDDAVRHVLGWLAESGVSDTRADGAWVRLNATIDTINTLFEADMAYYSYRNSTTPVLRAQSYSIPEELSSYVDFVFPLSHFMPPGDSHQLSTKQTPPPARRSRRLSRIERRQNKLPGGPGGSGGGGGDKGDKGGGGGGLGISFGPPSGPSKPGSGGSKGGGSSTGNNGNNGGSNAPSGPGGPISGPGSSPGNGGSNDGGGIWSGWGWDGQGQGRGNGNATYPAWPSMMACIPGIMTPGCIRQMYNWPLYPRPGATNQSTATRVLESTTIFASGHPKPTATGIFARFARYERHPRPEPPSPASPTAVSLGPISSVEEKNQTILTPVSAATGQTPSFTIPPFSIPPSALPTAPVLNSPVRLGVAGFLSEYVNHQDVNEFLQFYAPTIGFPIPGNPAYNFTTVNVNGGTNPQMPRFLAGVEASLDIEYAMALGYPSQVTFYSTGGTADKINPTGGRRDPRKSSNEPYLDLLDYLINQPADAVPHVLSISYSDDEQTVPQPYATRVCQMFMQLAARGTTVLVATGDGGSHGISDACIHGDGPNKRPLIPTFPSSCPWVTAVGSTETGTASSPGGIPPPVAADYSSGGFSNYFSRPAWQNDTVNAYLDRVGDSKAGLFNRAGRGTPDISVIGSRFSVIWGGVPTFTGGTSASTPVIAAMVALINDKRLRAGKPSLGWLNGALYSAPVQSILEDVTTGTSKGCGPFNRTAWTSGWTAAPGWDAVTGLGVPNDFAKLSAALMEV